MQGRAAKNRLVIGDINAGPYKIALQQFREMGWEVAAFANFKDMLIDITKHPPRLIVTNLMLYNGSGLKILELVETHPALKNTKVLIVSSFANKENIAECLRRGAKDFIVTPFPPENLYRRLVYHLQDKKEIDDHVLTEPRSRPAHARPSTDIKHAFAVVGEILHKVAQGEDHYATLYSVTKNMAEIVQINRCSCIIADPQGIHGLVVASQDDPGIKALTIDLVKYPEITHVMNTGLIVIVDDIMKNPMTRGIRQQVKTIQIMNIMVLPVKYAGEIVGVISLRSDAQHNPFNLEVARICQSIANSSAPVVKFLRDFLIGGTIHGPGRKAS